jgi:hypothetical protein
VTVRDGSGKDVWSQIVAAPLSENEELQAVSARAFLFANVVSAYVVRGSRDAALVVEWGVLPSHPPLSQYQFIGVVTGAVRPFPGPVKGTFLFEQTANHDLVQLRQDPSLAEEVFDDEVSGEGYTLLVPVRVDFGRGALLPAQTCENRDALPELRHACRFKIWANTEPVPQRVRVRLWTDPLRGRASRLVDVAAGTKAVFLEALSDRIWGSRQIELPAKNEWLRVEIAGQTGWVHEPRDLYALGLGDGVE